MRPTTRNFCISDRRFHHCKYGNAICQCPITTGYNVKQVDNSLVDTMSMQQYLCSTAATAILCRSCLPATTGRTTAGHRHMHPRERLCGLLGSRMSVGKNRTTTGGRIPVGILEDGYNLKRLRHGILPNSTTSGRLNERYDKSTKQPQPTKVMESRQKLPLQLRCANPRPSLLPKGARRHKGPTTNDDGHRPDQMQLQKDEQPYAPRSL